MIIGINGQALSGKDTVGDYLVKQHNFEKASFADILKDAVCALLGIHRSELEEWKLDEHIKVVIENQKSPSVHLVQMSFRRFLQRFGTEMGREVFGYDFWVDLIKPQLHQYKDYVFTDCRFANEAQWIKNQGGVVIELVRPETANTDEHLSEKKLPYDLVDVTIMNDDTLEHLYAEVDAALFSVGGFI